MKGRGTRLFVISMTLCILSVTAGHASPTGGPGALRPRSFALDRLCQDRSGDEIDYSRYFTAPEREGGTIYVFYNNIIEPEDDAQFAYALLYGLEFTAQAAGEKDVLAVGLYFKNDKGKIYLIEKNKFVEFQNKNLPVEKLLDYMKIHEVNTARGDSLGTMTRK